MMEAWSRRIYNIHGVETDTMLMDKDSSNFKKVNFMPPEIYEILLSKYFNEISKFNLVNLHNDLKFFSSNVDHF